MKGKTQREELEERKAGQETTLRQITAMHAQKLRDVAGLERAAAAGLASVDVAELEEEARRQATARVELEAARLAEAELARRVAETQAAIAAIGQQILAAERDEVAAMGAALAAEIESDAAALLAKLEGLAQLSTRHASLDQRARPAPGWSGSPLRDAPKLSEMAGAIASVLDALRVQRNKAREAAARPPAPGYRPNRRPMGVNPPAVKIVQDTSGFEM